MRLKATEGEFQASIIELAEACHFNVYHVANVRRHLRSHTGPGFPDLVLCKGALLVFAELKTQSGVVSKDQKRWLVGLQNTFRWRDGLPPLQGWPDFQNYIGPSGGVVVWRPQHWPEIEKLLFQQEGVELWRRK